MNVAVLTNCQPRHISLIERMASIADTVYACIEVTTLFPGEVADHYAKSDVMKDYFSRVGAAERAEFGEPRFLPSNVIAFPMKSGDISKLDLASLLPLRDVDAAVVFGASFIRQPLVDLLVEKETLNLHMGTSPFYRGSSCNFWAAYDHNPDYVGATVHMLTKGLDSGPMLCHAFPTLDEHESLDYFALGMRAVSAGIDCIVSLIESGLWRDLERVPQDRSVEIRYTRNSDFDDIAAREFMANAPTPDAIAKALGDRDNKKFLLPFVTQKEKANPAAAGTQRSPAKPTGG